MSEILETLLHGFELGMETTVLQVSEILSAETEHGREKNEMKLLKTTGK